MKSEIKSGGWTRSPPEVLSNPTILWFCDSVNSNK